MLAYTSNQPAPVYLTPAGGVETLTRDLIAPGIDAEPTRLSAAYRLAALPDASAAAAALAAALCPGRPGGRGGGGSAPLAFPYVNRFLLKSTFVWGVCMGARGAYTPK